MLMPQTQIKSNPFEGQLDVVATLGRRAIEASVAELRKQDELTIALRDAVKQGVSLDDLSEACGLRPEEIRRRVERDLHVESDLDEMIGAR
jgi:hypothetical protein